MAGKCGLIIITIMEKIKERRFTLAFRLRQTITTKDNLRPMKNANAATTSKQCYLKVNEQIRLHYWHKICGKMSCF